MSDETAQPPVTNNEAEQQYETRVDGHLAILTYERDGKRILFLHTGVPHALEGRGVGGALAKTALDAAQAAQLEVIPLCPFVAAYIRRHREYLPLLSEKQQARLLGEQ